MAQLGEPTTEKGSGHVTAALHRGWIEVKQSLAGGDPSLLESVEQGEHAARESYQRALQAALPESILMIVGEQSGAILAAQDQVKALRDRRAASLNAGDAWISKLGPQSKRVTKHHAKPPCRNAFVPGYG